MKKIIAIVVIAFIIVGAFLWNKSRSSPVATKEQQNKTLVYRNEKNGYTLEYPSNLKIKEYSSDDVVFGNIENNFVDGVAEVRAFSLTGKPGQTFEQAVAEEMKKLCAADGPGMSFSCTGVEQVLPFVASSGVQGYTFYLKGELKNLKENTVTEIKKGPYFVFAVKSGATGSSALVVHPPLNKSAEEADAPVIKAIAKSLRINSPSQTDTTLEEYISSRISELSPIKEQLGGKFYVTKIEAHGGAGTVEYEDGHNAYTADFTYIVDQSGKLSVTSFKVR